MKQHTHRKRSTLAAAFLALFLLVALLAGVNGPAEGLARAQTDGGLFQPTARQGTLGPDYTASALRGRFVQLDSSPLSDPTGERAASLRLNLFDDANFAATRYEVRQAIGGRIVWLGKVEGEPFSQVTLVWGQGMLFGNIDVADRSYQIRWAGNDVHSIFEVDPSISPPTSQPIEVPNLLPATDAQLARPGSDPIVIDVFVPWTPAARIAVGGIEPMLSRITLAVAETNTSYENSQVNQRIRLVHATETNYEESGNSSTDLIRLRLPNDGYMDELHPLRDLYGADMVSLIFNFSGVCGQAFLMGTPSPQFASSAFSVVYWSCATGVYSFGHELGHNMGSHHDRANAGGTPSYPYSYGYQAATCNPRFRTVMAYNCAAGCTRVPYFSNPDVTLYGCPTGVDENAPDAANNALSLNNTAPVVAAWRSGPVGSPTVTASGTPPTPTLTPCYEPPIFVQGSISAADPVLQGRLFRDDPEGTCAIPQACAVFDQVERHYDSYVYTNTSGAERCVTVQLNAGTCTGTQFLHSAAYLGSFNPANLCQNFLADIGGSPNPFKSYSFSVPSGSTFVVVVNETTANAGCPSYALSIGGLTLCATSTPTPPSSTATPTAPTSTATATTTLTQTSTPTSTSSTTATAIPTSCRVEFADVPPSSTFYRFVRCLACRGIVSGYEDGTFKPGNLVTRGQLAKIVSNAAGLGDDPGPQVFEDVPPTQSFFEWINRLTNRGYMSGYTCGGAGEPCVNNRPYFRPFANATRGQTAKIVAEAAQISAPPSGQTFEDVPPSHPFHQWIEALSALQVMGGYPCGDPGEPCVNGRPYFRPQLDVTRGQSAKIAAGAFYPDCAP